MAGDDITAACAATAAGVVAAGVDAGVAAGFDAVMLLGLMLV